MYAKDFKGVIISPITTFDENGVFDEKRQKSFIQFLISKGIHGIFALGTAGQGPLISTNERKLITETILESAGNKIPVIVQCGAYNTKETVELVKHAKSSGAQAIASLPPFYARLDYEAFEIHFAQIHDAAGGLPVFVYNNPWAQGRALNVDELLMLNNKGYINGVADSSRDIGSVYKMLPHKETLTCIIADTKLSMMSRAFGCNGMISAIGNAIPELFVAMNNAIESKDFEKAMELQLRIFKLSESLRSPEIGAFHYALKSRGIDGGSPRSPVRQVNEKERMEIDKVMKNFVNSLE